MISFRKVGLISLSLFAFFCSLSLPVFGQTKSAPVKDAPVKVGMVKSLFTDVPAPLLHFVAGAFGSMTKEFTGMNGQMIIGGAALELAKDLQDGKVHLAVFHGVEFGWAQQKFPELRPLMVAINKQKHLQANIVANKDGAVASLADLKGKDIALPLRTKDHCRMFLERGCKDTAKCCTKEFFGKLTTPANIEAALDDIVAGTSLAAVVDSVALEFYNELKPGCFNRLKVIRQSEIFPAAVIAYKNGGLDQGTLEKFQGGMQSANQSSKGREMMHMFMITSFEPVPTDYAQTLANIIKAYPSPSGVPTSTQTNGQ